MDAWHLGYRAGRAASLEDSEEPEAELAWQLAEAHHQQDRLADLLRRPSRHQDLLARRPRDISRTR
jgi:hypothetical protein